MLSMRSARSHISNHWRWAFIAPATNIAQPPPHRPLHYPRHQRGYILLTLLFILVGVSALFFTVSPPDKTVENIKSDYEKLELIKRTIINNIIVGRDALDDENTYGGFDDYPGVIQCPENLNNIGTSAEGQSGTRSCRSVTPTSFNSVNYGRIAWRTLGLSNIKDSAGESFWIVVDPEFTRTTSLTNFVKGSTPSRLEWDDGNGEEPTAVIIFSPGRALTTQNRTAITSSSTPSVYADYLEITDPLIRLSNSRVVIRKLDYSNDRFVSISRKEWLKAVHARIANVMDSCINNFSAPSLPSMTQTNFANLNISPSSPSIFQASKDLCSNIFFRATQIYSAPSSSIPSSTPSINDVYNILENNDKYRTCCGNPSLSLQTNSTPSICFVSNASLPSLTVAGYLAELSYPSSSVCAETACNSPSNNILPVCQNARWMSGWYNKVFIKTKDFTNNTSLIMLNLNGYQTIATDIIAIIGNSAPQPNNDCSLINAATPSSPYPYLIVNGQRYCPMSTDGIAYKR